MKIGIISDIHSNIYAFKACTEYMENTNVTSTSFLEIIFPIHLTQEKPWIICMNLWKTIPVICKGQS